MGSEVNRNRIDRFVDLASVVLISVAAVLTALCGYQSGRWGGEQTKLYSIANADRVQSSEFAARGNVLTAIDIVVFLDYMNAVYAKDKQREQFLYARFRHEARPAIRAWLASNPLTNSHAPSSPFVMQEYKLRANADAKKQLDMADESFSAALEANQRSDAFLLLTVVFSGISFLAGVSTKMVFPRHLVVIVIAIIALVYGLFRLVGLPYL